jgi:lysozyme
MTRFSKQGLELLKEVEGFRNQAYQDSVGIWTIGYGHTGSLIALKDQTGLTFHPETHSVFKGLTLTNEQCDLLLKSDIAHVEDVVKDIVGESVNNNQYSALVIWAFNIGANAAENSTLAHNFFDMRTDPETFVPAQLRRWNKAGGRVLKGLVNRREKEILLFQTPDDPEDKNGAFLEDFAMSRSDEVTVASTSTAIDTTGNLT